MSNLVAFGAVAPCRSCITFTVLFFWMIPLAAAQSNLGELLEAGARKLSAEEFRQDVVRHVIVGPASTGGTLELMYLPSGAIQGKGISIPPKHLLLTISGEWATDDNGRVCTNMQMGYSPPKRLPLHCEFWFKVRDRYVISDSDSDPAAKVLHRTIKQ